MPKITLYGGATNAGLTERAGGFVENTAGTRAQAVQRQEQAGETSFLGDGGDDSGQVEQAGLVAGGEPATEAPFDPADLSVADVQGLLAECTDAERAAVVEAERNGKNRKGITGE